MDLPKNEAVFDFEAIGLTTDKKYDGQFTVVCVLNMARKHALEIEKTRLMADFSNPTETLFGLATILANLRVRIVEAPEWWKQSKGGFDLMDEDVLVTLYDKVMETEAEMAGTTEKPSEENREPSSSDTELTIVEAIQRIAHHNAFAELDNERQLILFLKSWWSRTYNRPLKDPLLESYTVEELLYEYYDRQERDLAADQYVEQEADRIETKKVQENLDWAEEEERKELEAMRTQQTAVKKRVEEPTSPLDDPANKAWMEKVIQEEMAKAKEEFGSNFGDDIDEEF